MAKTLEVQLPNGKTAEMEIPDGMSADELHSTIDQISGQHSEPLPLQDSSFQGTLQQLAPSNVLKEVGVGAANAPGMASTLINSLPGIGNPANIVPGLQNVLQNPQQVPNALNRMMQTNAGAPVNAQEKMPALAGQIAGSVMEATMPPIGEFAGGASEQAGKALDALSAPTRAAASAAYGAAVKKAGLSLPGELLDTPVAKQKIIEYAEGLHPLLDKTPKQITEVMEPEGMYRLYKQIGDILDNTKVANLSKDVRQMIPKQTNVNLLQIKEALGEAIKLAKPSMAEPMTNYGNMLARSNALRSLGKAAVTASKIAGPGAAVAAGIHYLGH